MKERKNFKIFLKKMAHLTDKHCGKHDISELYMWNHEIGPNQIYPKKFFTQAKKCTTELFSMQIQNETKNFFSICERWTLWKNDMKELHLWNYKTGINNQIYRKWKMYHKKYFL